MLLFSGAPPHYGCSFAIATAVVPGYVSAMVLLLILIALWVFWQLRRRRQLTNQRAQLRSTWGKPDERQRDLPALRDFHEICPALWPGLTEPIDLNDLLGELGETPKRWISVSSVVLSSTKSACNSSNGCSSGVPACVATSCATSCSTVMKLDESAPGDGPLIHTVRGFGYVVREAGR